MQNNCSPTHKCSGEHFLSDSDTGRFTGLSEDTTRVQELKALGIALYVSPNVRSFIPIVTFKSRKLRGGSAATIRTRSTFGDRS